MGGREPEGARRPHRALAGGDLVALAGKRVDGAPAGQVLAPARVVVCDLLPDVGVHVPVDGVACSTHAATPGVRRGHTRTHDETRAPGTRTHTDTHTNSPITASRDGPSAHTPHGSRHRRAAAASLPLGLRVLALVGPPGPTKFADQPQLNGLSIPRQQRGAW